MDQLWYALGHTKGALFGNFDTDWLKFGQALVLADTGYEDAGVYVLSDECSILDASTYVVSCYANQKSATDNIAMITDVFSNSDTTQYFSKCPFTRVLRMQSDQNYTLPVDTSYQTTWRIINTGHRDEIPRDFRSGLLCEIRPNIVEKGVYHLNVGRCEIQPLFEPTNAYNPLIIFGSLLLLIATLCCVVRHIRQRRAKEKDTTCFDLEADVHMTTFYALRGTLIGLLIFLTSGAGGYAMFTKSWGGLTLSELVFQSFIWSVGVKIPSTIDGSFARGQTKGMVLKSIFKRFVVLFIVGVTIDSTVVAKRQTSSLWLPMQRIAIAYIFSALIYALTVRKFVVKSKSILSKGLANFVSLLWCWVFGLCCIMLLVICTGMLVSINCQWNIPLNFPLDRFPLPVVEQNFTNCDVDVARRVNALVTGVTTPFYLNEYLVFTKGLMGIVATIVQCFVGLKTGVVYHHHQSHRDRLSLWAAWGSVFALGAVVFAGSSAPFHINLWPIASILLISTASLMMLALTYVIVEMRRYLPCVTINRVGTTSLLVLSGHLLFCHSLPFYWGIAFSSHFEFLAQNLWTVIVWFIIATVLATKGVRFPV